MAQGLNTIRFSGIEQVSDTSLEFRVVGWDLRHLGSRTTHFKGSSLHYREWSEQGESQSRI